MIEHQPVLLPETIAGLALQPGQIVLDVTAGGGSFSEAIARQVGPTGMVIALDQDDASLEIARRRLRELPQVKFHRANFRELRQVLRSFEIEQVDAVCADLGLASFQLDDPERGFSFRSERELDMRLDRRSPRTAAVLLAAASEEELGRIFREYGEEARWRAVARLTVRERQSDRPFTGRAFAELVHRAVGTPRRRGIDSATQVFQALRIAVNDELNALDELLDASISLLRSGGRLAVIAYHSLEDRRIKRRFQEEEKGCLCPPNIPTCVCGHRPRLRVLTRKPLAPSAEEVRGNPRARSAKLRVAEKIGESPIHERG